MPVADQRALSADSTLTAVDEPDGEEPSPGFDFAPGVDPGEPESWEIFRVHCPECDQPIALVGEEERLPQHAVLRTAWHPFSPALCPGSGLPADDLEESGPEPDTDGALAGLFARPADLDWRTQPFSHAGGPGSTPGTTPGGHRVPAMRGAAEARLVRR
ncbi:hypothetical protein P3T36_000862 [Kitasatospora sp. MAP12-15]|uniref:hypothetical protein n=1 Tax=unclassified Kitasatospora TaxID=2633591 RepID=UPI002477066A|nr:hypothetical protein [Kitasatospora sp. MAP12-44]MDH6114462.1 hypothetical protein [Kitasatospora sp. MAP12-44]